MCLYARTVPAHFVVGLCRCFRTLSNTYLYDRLNDGVVNIYVDVNVNVNIDVKC